MELGKILFSKRKEKGISAEAIAEKLGVSSATIYRYENGDIEKVPVSVFIKIAEILNTPPEAILALLKDEPAETKQHAKKGAISMYKVLKRDGKIVEFDISKIENAILKAFEATGTPSNDDIIQTIALRVTAHYSPRIKGGLVDIETIQDSVEAVLSSCGYENVAKAYILYRKQHEKLRNTKSTYLDYKDTVNKYLKVEDWRVKENSTVTYSVGGLILSNSGAITANYWLSEVYDQEIADAHRRCDMHIHDLSMLTAYCAGWSLKQLIKEGLGIPGKITSAPAGHLSTLCNQMVNFLGIMQNEWAGAQAFSSFDTYLAPFVRVDNLTYKEVKQCIQSFVFGVNTPSRWGTQAPFTNVTLD